MQLQLWGARIMGNAAKPLWGRWVEVFVPLSLISFAAAVDVPGTQVLSGLPESH